MPGMRELYENIANSNSQSLYQELLIDWFAQHDYSTFFSAISEKFSPTVDYQQEQHVELSWELYAFSRVLDLLTLPFQPESEFHGRSPKVQLELAQYIEFILSAGLSLPDVKSFHPFYYEIIKAIPGKDNFTLTESLYPPVMHKNLLIKRGGAIITLNPTSYDLNIINNALIYWAFCRKNRPCQDLSYGWGSNSQWRTRFRFDFDLDDTFVYNAGGDQNLSKPCNSLLNELTQDELTLDQAKDLVIYRHAMQAISNSDDLFPYDYCYWQPK